MYATVTRFQVKPGAAAEGRRLWREQVGDLLRRVPGVRAIHALHDPATETGLTVILWDSQAAVEAYVQSDQRRQALAPFADLFAAPPPAPEGYDLLYTTAE